MIRTSILFAALLSFCGSQTQGAVIPPAFLDCVAALGDPIIQKMSTDGKSIVDVTSWFTQGTGFFYGHLIQAAPGAPKAYRVYLVTAGHVIAEHDKNVDIQVRINSKSAGASSEFQLPLNPPQGASKWFFGDMAKGEDVAVIQIDFNKISQMGLQAQFFPSDMFASDKIQMATDQVSAGDGVFVLGFPMDMAGRDKNYTIVRQGVIAKVSDLYDGANPDFMIDAFVFPGNSGGPVISRPEAIAIIGTKPEPSAKLIGMVISYAPYTDIAVSQQTHHQRITFEENSGLANVVPMDVINRVIGRLEALSLPASPAQPASVPKPNQQAPSQSQPTPSQKSLPHPPG